MGAESSKQVKEIHTESTIATEAFLNQLASRGQRPTQSNTEEFLRDIQSRLNAASADPTYSATSVTSAVMQQGAGKQCGQSGGGVESETATVTADKLMQELVRIAKAKQHGGAIEETTESDDSDEEEDSPSDEEEESPSDEEEEDSEGGSSDSESGSVSSLGLSRRMKKIHNEDTELASSSVAAPAKKWDETETVSESPVDTPVSASGGAPSYGRSGRRSVQKNESEEFTVTTPYEMSDVTIDTPGISLEKKKGRKGGKKH